MNTKAILYTLLFLGLIIGGYFFFQHLSKSKESKLWDLVPESSVGVFERGNCTTCIDSLKVTAWFSLFKNGVFDRKSIDTSTLNSFLRVTRRAHLISLHKTAKHEFEFIFFGLSAEMLPFEELMTLKGWKKRERSFSGLVIHEFVRDNNMVAWVEVKNFIAISSSSVLIEDVVRTTQEESVESFLSTVKKVASLPFVKNDGGNVLINLAAFNGWLNLFMNEAGEPGIKITGSSILDVKRDDHSIVLKGFSDPDSSDMSSLLQLFNGQTPVSFNLRRQISNDANFVLSLGFSDPLLLGKNLQGTIPEFKRRELLSAVSLDDNTLTALYKELGTEVALQTVEMSAGRTVNLFLIDLKNSSAWISILDRLAEEAKADTVYAETYSNYLIKKMGGTSLLNVVFPNIKLEARDLYFAQLGSVFIFSSDLDAIKKVVNDIDQENTWGKSLEKNRFLESTLLESNISIYFDPDKSIRVGHQSLSERWQLFTQNNAKIISALDLSAIQFSHLNDNFYTNIYLGINDMAQENNRANRIQNSLNLAESNIHRIFVLKNHNDRNFEVAVQDSTQTLRLISSTGEVLWSKKLDGLIEDQMQQIDHFANGKLQMLFSTGKQLHMIDRLGNYVKPYPVSYAMQTKLLGVIDYDHSKNYRFALSDREGNLYMVDKQSNLLEGWKPLITRSGELLVSPKHFRISGRDYIAVVHKKGEFSLYNRRGEMVKGFPVDLKARLKHNFAYISNSGSEQSHFVFITIDGYKVKVDLKGNEIERESLIKPSIETNFALVNEENDKSYLVVRQDNRSVTLLDENGAEILSNNYVGLNSVEVRMYDFGSANVYYTIVDQDQELGYVYNAAGQLLTSQPIQCQDLSLYLYKKKLSVISSYQKSLSINQLN